MSQRKGPPRPGLAMVALLSARWPELAAPLETALVAHFGPVVHDSGLLPFAATDYYRQELGEPLCRRFLAFAQPLPQDALAAAKVWSNALEARLARSDGRRRVDIDPGLLTQERLVLASAKNFTHRVYLGQGIYADLTLFYQRGRWQELPWTFPEYRTPAVQAQLTAMRQCYRQLLATPPFATEPP